MQIRQDDYIGSSGAPKIEDQARAYQEILDRWGIIFEFIKHPGWAILTEYIDKEFETHNSVYNARPEELEYKRGLCTGLKFPAQTIHNMKRKAVEAQKFLTSIAKQEGKND